MVLVPHTPEPQRAPFLLSCDTEKTAIYEPGNMLSLDTESPSTSILDSPVSRTEKHLLFINHPVYCIFVTAAPED